MVSTTSLRKLSFFTVCLCKIIDVKELEIFLGYENTLEVFEPGPNPSKLQIYMEDKDILLCISVLMQASGEVGRRTDVVHVYEIHIWARGC